MTSPDSWVTVVTGENVPGFDPVAATKAWLRERGVDGMPFADSELRIDLACGLDEDGRRAGWFSVRIQAGALRRAGLQDRL